MNEIILKGRLAADPEMAYVGQDNKARARFVIAVDRRFQRDKADFVRCEVWNKLAELINHYCHKGSEILVRGELHIERYEDKYYTTVSVERFEFCGQHREERTDDPGDAVPAAGGFEAMEEVDDDDLPF